MSIEPSRLQAAQQPHLHCTQAVTVAPFPWIPRKGSSLWSCHCRPRDWFSGSFWPALGRAWQSKYQTISNSTFRRGFCFPPSSHKGKGLRFWETALPHIDKDLLHCRSKNDQAIYFKFVLNKTFCNISLYALSFFFHTKLIMNVQNHSVACIFNWPGVYYALLLFF